MYTVSLPASPPSFGSRGLAPTLAHGKPPSHSGRGALAKGTSESNVLSEAIPSLSRGAESKGIFPPVEPAYAGIKGTETNGTDKAVIVALESTYVHWQDLQVLEHSATWRK